MRVRRLQMLPVECVARAYLTGGGLREYRADGHVSGVRLPDGLTDGSRLPEPVFTPSTKAPKGEHDEPMSYAQVEALIGADLAAQARDLTVAILNRGNEIAGARGILIADTKVEFGVVDGRLVLADEVLTPDSSRFWPADQWEPGRPQPSFDKEYVREWLTSPESGWDRGSGAPPPRLPDDVVERTRAKYVERTNVSPGRSSRPPGEPGRRSPAGTAPISRAGRRRRARRVRRRATCGRPRARHRASSARPPG